MPANGGRHFAIGRGNGFLQECFLDFDPALFEEAHTSRHGLFRVFKILNVSQESKAWCDDPKNKLCDRPGSWYCPGRYPPGFPEPPKTHRNIDYQKAAMMGAQRAML